MARLPLLFLCLLWSSAASAVEPAHVSVRKLGGSIRITSGAARADVRLAPLRLKVLAGRRGVVRSTAAGFLGYERGTSAVTLGAVQSHTTLPDGVSLSVATSEGSAVATVSIRFLTTRTLEIALDPPGPVPSL